MEIQAAKKILVEEEEEKEKEDIDRISKLPQAILHHILCSLSQRHAIQTSVLSKSWRHVASTRPKITFRVYEDFSFNLVKDKNQEPLVSVLDKTLQSYHDRGLSVQELDVRMLVIDRPILEKWIPVVMLDMRVEIFRLVFHNEKTEFFDVPSVVFEAESLRVLHLNSCSLNREYCIDKVLCKHLQTLHLYQVFVDEETIEMLLSNCPLIENVSLLDCFGLRNVRVVDKPRALKHFVVSRVTSAEPISVEIEFPTISTISISRCLLPQHNMYLPHLVCLFLTEVRLSGESFESFSCDFPCIQKMQLFNCTGFKEFNLISHSIKHLCIVNSVHDDPLCKAAISAPSIVSFDYIGPVLQSFSFTTTSSEWKSDIDLSAFSANSDNAASVWFDNLNGLLTELKQSKIYLTVMEPKRINKINFEGVFLDKPNPVPVVVERLKLWSSKLLCKYFSAFLNPLFRICRPRYIGRYCFFHNEPSGNHNKLLEFLCEIFLKEGETRDHHSFWQCGLEEVSMEAFDMNINEWRPVQSTSSVAGVAIQFCFGLKWRELI